LRDNLLPIASNALNAFGFITTRDAEEERQLGGLYAALPKESQNPQSIFQEVLKAIETNTLADLFDIKESPTSARFSQSSRASSKPH
jgi:hypothetical protein